MSAPQTDTPAFVRAEYLESGSFVSSEEACELAGIKIGERVAILKMADFESLERELSEAKKQIENLTPGFIAGNEALEKLSALQAHYLALEERCDALRGIAERLATAIRRNGMGNWRSYAGLLSELDALKGKK